MSLLLGLMALCLVCGAGPCPRSQVPMRRLVRWSRCWTNYMQGSLGTLLALVAGGDQVGIGDGGPVGGMFTGFGVAAAAFYIPNIIPTITTGLM